MQKSFALNVPAMTALSKPLNTLTASAPLSEQDQIIQSLHKQSLWLTLVSFFGFGLLLAFTPCIFPMIPILSGIIVGKGHQHTTLTAFLLSLSYVVASALTYTTFGVLAALFGSNLQATLQQPWIIAAFSGIFVILALSMFGFYNLEVPKAFQARLHNSSEKFRNRSYWGAALMGALSSLIVGPCVAAPLAGALIYIGQTGDVLLGGSALFAMGMGMGVPLLILGASAGKLLPKAGHWLNTTKAAFGVIMLAVAVWMLDRILPPAITMLLWTLLLIIPAVYLRAVDSLPEHSTNWSRFWKGVGVVLFIYGVLLLIGLSSGGTNPLKPLQNFSAGQANTFKPLVFKRIRSNTEFDAVLQAASAQQQMVMLDFYADWCISCKEMEAYTFTDPKVQQRLSNMLLVQADVTDNTPEDQALLKRFNLVGPPATLFFASDQSEKTAYRVIGFKDAEHFLADLASLR
jgi:thiol:disulfide interchange protein DsbD